MPLARHDGAEIELPADKIAFLLTCLLRGMTGRSDAVRETYRVSTHMPLARHDNTDKRERLNSDGFYSHASCEA